MAKQFHWGTVQETHEIGPYTIIEYIDKDDGAIWFHGENESWPTLDEALVGLIVRRNLGLNHRQVNEHFMAGIRAMAENK